MRKKKFQWQDFPRSEWDSLIRLKRTQTEWEYLDSLLKLALCLQDMVYATLNEMMEERGIAKPNQYMLRFAAHEAMTKYPDIDWSIIKIPTKGYHFIALCP